jgi:hypothetical protein
VFFFRACSGWQRCCKASLALGQGTGATPKGGKQVLYLDSTHLTGVSSNAKKQRIRNKFRSFWTLFFNRWYNRQSAIGNRQSAIGNRQSAIGNRQSAIGNRQSAK